MSNITNNVIYYSKILHKRMKTSINQRIKILVDHFYDGNQRRASQETGINPSTIATIYKNRAEPGFTSAAVFYEKLRSEVNPDWFLIGDGNLERSSNDSNVANEPNANYSNLITRTLENRILYLQNMPKNFYVFGYDLMPGDKPVGKNYYMNLFRLFKKAHDIPKEYSIYSFKHTGAIMAVNAGVPVKDIQMQMRHHSLDITDKYLSQMMAVDSDAIRNKMPDI